MTPTRTAALVLAGAAVLTLATIPPAPSTEAHHRPVGGCDALTSTLHATGTWNDRGISLSGTRRTPRIGRDTRTVIAVSGVGTFPNVGPAVHLPRRGLTTAPHARATFVREGGLTDYTCEFTLARH